MSKKQISELQQERLKFKPALPAIFKNGPSQAVAKLGAPTKSISDEETVKKLFPGTYGMPIVSFVRGKKHCCFQKGCKGSRGPFRRTGAGRS